MAFGRGKVILLGEHGVVYGHPALAAGIERGVHATATEAAAAQLSIPVWDIEVTPSCEAGENLGRAFDALVNVYDTPPRLAVRAEVALPAGAGLGCSAALGVAILGAMDEALGVERSAEERADVSLAWERVFHGNPSGVDSAMASTGGVAVFQKGKDLEPILPRNPLTLIIANTGDSASTKTMVDSVARERERNRERVDGVFDAIAAVVRNGALAVSAGDWNALGQLMDLNQGLLASLLLSTEKLDDLCHLAREAGAFGAKLTGSGGGGCMVALAADRTSAETILHAIEGIAEEAFIAEVGT
ncbi:MAG: mevalonate kinase [Deltaproteobacteria bacterium]|nr:mevalonate kinase [Deltaproteobacteria bacterium]